MNKYGYVDAARAIAILLVIASHAYQPFSKGLPTAMNWALGAGQFGVQLFFVVSAYTLSLSWAKNSHYIPFLVRRFFRIAPLYYLAIPLYFCYFTASGSAASFTPQNVVANIFFVHGFFADAHNSIVPGGWSIGTEMAFYVLFPLVFSVTAKLARWSDLAAPCLAALLAILAAILWPVTPSTDTTFRFHSIALQLPVFVLGIWVFIRPEIRPIRDLICFAALACTAIILLRYKSGLPLMMGATFAMFLRILATWKSPPSWLQRIGEMSFSLYIVHFVFAWGVGNYIAGIAPSASVGFLANYFIAIAGSCMLATATYRYVELQGISVGHMISTGLAFRKKSPS